MRFSVSSALAGALSLGLLFMPSTVLGCERECQVNVSHAFADKYQDVSSQYFTLLSNKFENSVFYGIPPQDTLTPIQATEAINLIKDAVVRAQNAWDVSIFQTVFDTIFKDEPKFKGDCNHPYRVKQPPPGVNWVISDCHLMDYICGNPPSICHFMPMIKTRITKKLMGQLQERVDGDDSDVYVNYVGPALQTLLTRHPKLVSHTAALHGNLNFVLEQVKGELYTFGNQTQWKREWDVDIRDLLLTFP